MPVYLECLNNGLPPLAAAAVTGETVAAATAVEAVTALSNVDPLLLKAKDFGNMLKTVGPYIPTAQHLPELEHLWKDKVKGFGEHADKYIEWYDGLKHLFEIGIKNVSGGIL